MKNKGMGFVGLIVALAVVVLMCYMMFNRPLQKSESAQQGFFKESGVDTTTYGSILDSAKSIVEKANQDKVISN